MPSHFVFITDNHHQVGASAGEPGKAPRTQRILEALVPQVNALSPDFVLHGGDVVAGHGGCDDKGDRYERAIEEAARILTGLTAPLHVIPGNHDRDPVDGSFARFTERIEFPDVLEIVEVGPRLRVALANVYESELPGVHHGLWTEDQDRLLREAAASALEDRCALILLQHAWVLEPRRLPDGTPIGAVKRCLELRETIAGCPAIVAVLTGHRHRNRISVVRDYLVADTGCLVEAPMGFREIWLQDDGTFLTRWHRLDAPDLVKSAFASRTEEQNDRSEGEEWDRNAEIFLPRLFDLWN